MHADMTSDGCENLYRNTAEERNGKVFAGSDGRKGYGAAAFRLRRCIRKTRSRRGRALEADMAANRQGSACARREASEACVVARARSSQNACSVGVNVSHGACSTSCSFA
jgi:hypothetical protein